jgi:hypothetical protein
MHGIFSQPWFDLEPFLDINSLAARKHDIACALAATYHMRATGTVGQQRLLYDQSFVELTERQSRLRAQNDPQFMDAARRLQPNQMAIWMKYQHDVVQLNEAIRLRVTTNGDYRIKHLAMACVDTPAMQHWQFLKDWVNAQRVFSEYGRMVVFVNEPGSVTITHRDYPPGMVQQDEFIWLAIDGRKRFWMMDEDGTQHPITSRAAFFSSADLHGSDPNIYPSYSIRIDGVFSEEFLARTALQGWKQA